MLDVVVFFTKNLDNTLDLKEEAILKRGSLLLFYFFGLEWNICIEADRGRLQGEIKIGLFRCINGNIPEYLPAVIMSVSLDYLHFIFIKTRIEKYEIQIIPQIVP